MLPRRLHDDGSEPVVGICMSLCASGDGGPYTAECREVEAAFRSTINELVFVAQPRKLQRRLLAHLEFDCARVVDNAHRRKKPVPLVRRKLIAGPGLQDASVV